MRRLGWAPVLITLAIGVASGLAIGAWRWSGRAERQAIPHQDITQSAVGGQDYDGEREAQLLLELDDPLPIRAPRSGLVTASPCTESGHLVSGTMVGAIDGHGLLGLATSVPLWRDLHLGDSGADVAALQSELDRLGFATPATGVFDRATATVVQAISKYSGWGDGRVIAVADVVWLPAPDIAVATCATTIGATVEQGSPLALAPPTVHAARVVTTSLPEALADRHWVFEAFGVAVPLRAGPSIDDADAVRLIAAATTLDPAQPAIAGKVRLAVAEPVLAVPPAAVAMTGPSSGCVVAIGAEPDAAPTPVDVEIVGSELGRTLVLRPPRPSAATLTMVRLDPDGCRAP